MPENGQENGVNGASAEKRKAEAGDGDSGAKKEKLEGGTLLFSGATDWKLVGRKTNEIGKSGNTQWTPVRLAALRDVNIVGVNKGCSSAFCLVIDEEGQVWAWGRNEGGQLGLGHMKDLLVPTLVQDLTGYNIVEIATGKAHALFLTSCGKVLAAGENEKGQCGQGKKTANLETPKLISHEGPEIVSVAAGAEFSVLLDKEGKVWTFGHPENGTLGHNDDGKFISRANKVDFRCEYSPKQVSIWVDKDAKTKEVTHLPIPKIVKISCGPQHTVVVDEDKKAYSWGFGGYGRLGHSETADQMVSPVILYFAFLTTSSFCSRSLARSRLSPERTAGCRTWCAAPPSVSGCARSRAWSTCGASTPPPRRPTCTPNPSQICPAGTPGASPATPR